MVDKLKFIQSQRRKRFYSLIIFHRELTTLKQFKISEKGGRIVIAYVFSRKVTSLFGQRS